MRQKVDRTMKASEIAEILQKNFRAKVIFKATGESMLTDEISYVSLSGKIGVRMSSHTPYQTVYFEEVASGKTVLIWENGNDEKNLSVYNGLTSENRRIYDIAIMSDGTKEELHSMGLL